MTCGFCASFLRQVTKGTRFNNESCLQLAEGMCRRKDERDRIGDAAFALRGCDRFRRGDFCRARARCGNYFEPAGLPWTLWNRARGGHDLPPAAEARSAKAERNR